MGSTQTYNWLKQISPAVLQWDQVPLFGKSPDFPWDELSSKLAQVFQIQSFRVTHQETDWRNPEDFTAGLGGEPLLLQVGVSNVEGTLIWVMSKSDINALMETLLGRPAEEFVALDQDFSRGFYRYLAAQTLFSLSQLSFGKTLGLGLIDPATLPSEPSLCLEIAIGLKEEKEAKGRLIISPEALTSWKQRWADRSLTTVLNSPLAEKLQVPVHLEIGRTKLRKSEWSAISPGDFIMLDHCTYDPEAEKGRVMLTINGKAIFRAKLKQGNIKILEFPFYHQANDETSNEENDEANDETTSMNNDDEEADDLGEYEDEEATLGDEEETLEEEHPSLEEENEEAEEQSESEEPSPVVPAVEAKDKRISPSDIALDIVIEVGRIQMSMQKLLELEPGNTLDLDIHPENGVDLVVNGRRIGKAELLRIGDNLGVRILDIG